MMNESRTDVLIDRIVSNEESGGEFAQFEAAAVSSPGEWERLARALRDELHVRGALSDALDGEAEGEIDRAYDARYAASGFTFHSWSGWAAAAVLALAWTMTIVLMRTGGTPVPPPPESSVRLASLSVDDALEQYLRLGEREGRIIEELPAVLVESFPAGDGEVEVVYVRQFLERDRIGRVYELAEDEHGSYVPVQVNPASLHSTPSSL